jgi:hypothetical protein
LQRQQIERDSEQAQIAMATAQHEAESRERRLTNEKNLSPEERDALQKEAQNYRAQQTQYDQQLEQWRQQKALLQKLIDQNQAQLAGQRPQGQETVGPPANMPAGATGAMETGPLPDPRARVNEFIAQMLRSADADERQQGRALSDVFAKLGDDAVAGFVQALESGDDDAAMAISGLAKAVIQEMRASLDAHSPSRVFAAIGGDVVAGFKVGLDGLGDAIDQAMAPALDPAKQQIMQQRLADLLPVDDAKERARQMGEAINSALDPRKLLAERVDELPKAAERFQKDIEALRAHGEETHTDVSKQIEQNQTDFQEAQRRRVQFLADEADRQAAGDNPFRHLDPTLPSQETAPIINRRLALLTPAGFNLEPLAPAAAVPTPTAPADTTAALATATGTTPALPPGTPAGTAAPATTPVPAPTENRAATLPPIQVTFQISSPLVTVSGPEAADPAAIAAQVQDILQAQAGPLTAQIAQAIAERLAATAGETDNRASQLAGSAA